MKFADLRSEQPVIPALLGLSVRAHLFHGQEVNHDQADL